MTHDTAHTLDRRSFLARTAATTAGLVGLAGTAAAQSSPPLVVGTTTPGRVYRDTETGWTQLGDDLTGASGSVLDLHVHGGTLFAATTTNTLQFQGTGAVYRWDGATWTQVGSDLGANVTGLVSFEGTLYAAVSIDSPECYRLDDDGWTAVVEETDAWGGAGSITVHDGAIYLGDAKRDLFGRYDGTSFTTEANYSGSCVYDFATLDGELYAGAFVGGFYRRDGGDWPAVDDAGASDLVAVASHAGSVFVGSVGNTLYRLDNGALTAVATLPDSVVELHDTGDALYVGTGQNAGQFSDSFPRAGEGRLYRYQDGSIEQVSTDDQFADAVQAITTLPTNEAPTASISVETADPITGEPVTFDGSASADPDGAIATFEWDLDGDGTVDATGETVEGIFSTPGEQTVTLRVTDDAGATATATATVTLALGVDIEIKPPEEPSPINPRRSNGLLPVAISGEQVDPASIDVGSIRVGPADVVAAGDGAAPVHGGTIEDATGDGTDDLVVHVPIADAGFDGDETVAVLRGEADGVSIVGRDEVTIVGGGAPPADDGPGDDRSGRDRNRGRRDRDRGTRDRDRGRRNRDRGRRDRTRRGRDRSRRGRGRRGRSRR